MSGSSDPTSPAPRSNADYRWTLPKALAFLDALAGCGTVAEAARRVGMSRQSAYALRARIAGTPLARGWELALRQGVVERHSRRARAGRWDGGLGELVRQGNTLAEQVDGCSGQADSFARKPTVSAPS